MTSEDADRIVRQLERQNAALESIAVSLEKMANPPRELSDIAKEVVSSKRPSGDREIGPFKEA